jgi:very-short-patch-repair endonuclease
MKLDFRDLKQDRMLIIEGYHVGRIFNMRLKGNQDRVTGVSHMIYSSIYVVM